MRISLLLVGAMLAASPAWAQTTDPIAATELFKQGRDAMAKGNYTAACQKFDDSARLDLKVGTLLNLAECEEHLGRIAAARQHLQRALDVARAQGDDRAELANGRLSALDKRVPRLTVTLASKIEGVRVRRDDVELGTGSLGSALPVEPGEHVVTVSAPRHQDRAFKVSLAEAEQRTVLVEPGPEAPSATSSLPEPKESAAGSTRTVGMVVGGIGVAATGAGAVFALIAMGDKSKSEQTCSGNLCDQAGFSAREDARTAGNLATGFFIGGVVAIAAGAALFLFSPSERKLARAFPLLSPSSARLGLGGAF